MLLFRNLITVRHQFMSMITGITSFIIKHTEAVKEVERSAMSPLEKVARYNLLLYLSLYKVSTYT